MKEKIRICSYLRSANYKPRDLNDLDWVFLAEVRWDGEKFMASYFTDGGYGEKITIPASEFNRKYRKMKEPRLKKLKPLEKTEVV